jgi:hypothetical protein
MTLGGAIVASAALSSGSETIGIDV